MTNFSENPPCGPCCCTHNAFCPAAKIVGEVLVAHTSEHCAVTRVGDIVYKYLRPRADLKNWERIQELALKNPDVLVPFVLDKENRIIEQEYVSGAHGDRKDIRRIYDTLHARGISGVSDIASKNIIGGRAIDFEFTPVDENLVYRVITKGKRKLEICAPAKKKESS